MHTIGNLAAIAIGGACGAMCRFGLSEALQRLGGAGFAWGTLAVNLLGCFAIGLAYHLAATTAVPAALRFALVVGFIGAFTTFSTFSLEIAEFLRDGQFTTAGLHLLLSNLAGVGLTFAGLALGHRLHVAMSH
jgi:fluoride exporter